MRLCIRRLRRQRNQGRGTECPKEATDGDTAGRSVLLVDLARCVAPFPEEHLRNSGFDLHLACTEQDALAALGRGEFAAVIVSGPARIPFLRALRDATPAPMLVLDRGADEDHMLEAFAVGVDQFQAQPVSPAEVVARLVALLRRR